MKIKLKITKNVAPINTQRNELKISDTNPGVPLRVNLPAFAFSAVVIQKIKMVPTQATMHHGHNASITYKLWKISQVTNAKPPSAPRLSPSHTQFGKTTRAIKRTASVMTTEKEIKPIIGLGKPNTDACSVTITEPHESTGLILQLGT